MMGKNARKSSKQSRHMWSAHHACSSHPADRSGMSAGRRRRSTRCRGETTTRTSKCTGSTVASRAHPTRNCGIPLFFSGGERGRHGQRSGRRTRGHRLAGTLRSQRPKAVLRAQPRRAASRSVLLPDPPVRGGDCHARILTLVKETRRPQAWATAWVTKRADLNHTPIALQYCGRHRPESFRARAEKWLSLLLEHAVLPPRIRSRW